jgi:stage II sporulation protein D
MRGKLVFFVLILAASALIAGWKIAHDPQCFIGGLAGPAELASVPRREGFDFPREVRVSLTTAPVSQVQMTVDRPYTAQPVGAAPRKPLRRESPGTTVVSVLPNGFRIGRREFRGTSLEIEAELSPAIWIEGHQYRGRVRFFRQPANKMLVVNVVPLEDYVASVVDGEMPAAFPEAARQAQAIVARTYVLFQTQTAHTNPVYDVYATTRSQNYLGCQYRGRDGRRYAAESASSRRVADQTAGMLCLCEGKLFCTYYTAVCGGKTAGGSAVFDDAAPALESVPCAWCQDAELYRWTHEMPATEASDALRRHLTSQGRRFDDLTSIRRIARTQNVREASFEVSDGKRRYRFSASDLRRLFPSSIHSFQFDARIADGQFLIEGRGHGHGVGLCQWGARGMAVGGSGPLDIIRHYYPGAEVVAVK